MESYIITEEFQKDIAKVGAHSRYYYRSKFDPVPSSELKDENEDERK